MTEYRKRQELTLGRMETAASFAKSLLDKLGIIQGWLYGIGKDDAAFEIDCLIAEQNAVWMALERIRQDVAKEMKVTA